MLENYSITDLKCVQDNPEAYVKEFTKAYHKFTQIFNTADSTWNHHKYNVFTILGTNPFFYDLQKEISQIVRQKVGPDERIWMAAWVNFHRYFEVLDWHNHLSDFHGYISIDPKKTKTRFRDMERENCTGDEWEIENEVGKFYLGPSLIEHKVETTEKYDGFRITIGLDFNIVPFVTEDVKNFNDRRIFLPIF